MGISYTGNTGRNVIPAFRAVFFGLPDFRTGLFKNIREGILAQFFTVHAVYRYKQYTTENFIINAYYYILTSQVLKH